MFLFSFHSPNGMQLFSSCLRRPLGISQFVQTVHDCKPEKSLASFGGLSDTQRQQNDFLLPKIMSEIKWVEFLWLTWSRLFWFHVKHVWPKLITANNNLEQILLQRSWVRSWLWGGNRLLNSEKRAEWMGKKTFCHIVLLLLMKVQ